MELRGVRGRLRWVWVGGSVCAVLLWRAAAYLSPGSFVTIPDGLHLPHALMGVSFLLAGVWAWSMRPNQWTDLFLLYGLSLGIHWGGAVGVTNASLEMSLFWVYLAFTALGDAALLHLALIYPHGKPMSSKWRVALYAPAAAALILAPATAFIPHSVIKPAIGLVLLIANLLSLSAGVLFLIRLFTVDGATRRAAHLPTIVAGMFSGSIIALLGAAKVLPGVPEAWNLTLVLVPITLAIALVHHSLEQPRALESGTP